jgi:hypothetical protein
MKKTTAITCLFLDIGGVLLTDGWDHEARKAAADRFNLDLKEMEDRPMFVQVARTLGIHGIHHVNCKSTRARWQPSD